MKCSFVWKNKSDGHSNLCTPESTRDSIRARALVLLANRQFTAETRDPVAFTAADHRHRETFPKKRFEKSIASDGANFAFDSRNASRSLFVLPQHSL